MEFKRKHGEFKQGSTWSERYTATDVLPPILPLKLPPIPKADIPADTPSLSFWSVFVFVARDTVHNSKHRLSPETGFFFSFFG